MTIRNDQELAQAQDALSTLYRAVAALREEAGTTNPQAFPVLAEGPRHEMQRLQAEIEAYTGVEVTARVEGEIREMDLDQQTFRLRKVAQGQEVVCRFGAELTPITPTLLGKRVRIIGVRSSATAAAVGPLDVVDIERVEVSDPTPPGASPEQA